LGIGGR